MALYLHCVICSRKQADGLIGGGVGRLELPWECTPTIPGSTDGRCAPCPSCMSENPDWQSSVLSSLELSSAAEAQANVSISVRQEARRG